MCKPQAHDFQNTFQLPFWNENTNWKGENDGDNIVIHSISCNDLWLLTESEKKNHLKIKCIMKQVRV